MSGDAPVRDILASFEEHLKQAAAQSIKDMIEKTLGEQFKAMELAEQGLRKEIMDIRQQQQDTIAKYELKQNDLQMQLEAEKRKNAETTKKLHDKLNHANTIAKSVAKDQEKLEKNVNELSATQRMTAGALEKVLTCFAGLDLTGNSMSVITAFLARMKDVGGSLFREGLVIPDGPEEVYMGEPDEDGDLKIFM